MLLKYTASERDNGRKVYSILRHELKISETLVRRMKRTDAIYIDGVSCYTDRRVICGEAVTADVAAAEPPCELVPERGELDILLETDGLLLLNKPVGILVHPSRARYTGTLSNYAAGYLGAKGEPPLCHAVNRLDRDTSGVVLLAKNTYMKALASEALQNAEKLYLALVLGEMPQRDGTIELPIKRLREGDMLRVTAEDGQRAVTHYETAAAGDLMGERVSLLTLRLETGRTHQIRVHCAACGCPLLGDALYGTERSRELSSALGLTAQQLHAYSLKFNDPLTGEGRNILAPMTRSDMVSVCRSLWGDSGKNMRFFRK